MRSPRAILSVKGGGGRSAKEVVFLALPDVVTEPLQQVPSSYCQGTCQPFTACPKVGRAGLVFDGAGAQGNNGPQRLHRRERAICESHASGRPGKDTSTGRYRSIKRRGIVMSLIGNLGVPGGRAPSCCLSAAVLVVLRWHHPSSPGELRSVISG